MKTIKEYIQKKHIGQNTYLSNMPKEAVSKNETMKKMVHIQLDLMAENPNFKVFYSHELGREVYLSKFKDYDNLEDILKDYNNNKDIWKNVFHGDETPYNFIGNIPIAFAIQEYIYSSHVTKDDIDKEKLCKTLEAADLIPIKLGTANIINVIIRNLWDLDIVAQILKKMYPGK